MHPFAFLLPLVSVFVGLAVTDVAKSLHVLLRARERVWWDALPLAAAFLAVLTTYNLWWRLVGTAAPAPLLTLGGFLILAAQLLVLYLLNAAALPDDVPADGLDLRAFYHANGPYFWTLFAVHVAVLMVTRAALFPSPGVAVIVQNAAALVLFAGLAVVRRRSIHAVALVAVSMLAIAGWAGLSLTAAP